MMLNLLLRCYRHYRHYRHCRCWYGPLLRIGFLMFFFLISIVFNYVIP